MNPETTKPQRVATASSNILVCRADNVDTTKLPTKTERVLSELINGWCGHRFQAERQLHDHSLHSTVSTLQNKHGIQIDRKTVVVTGFQGAKTRVSKYWLNKKYMGKAQNLLNHFRQKRGEGSDNQSEAAA